MMGATRWHPRCHVNSEILCVFYEPDIQFFSAPPWHDQAGALHQTVTGLSRGEKFLRSKPLKGFKNSTETRSELLIVAISFRKGIERGPKIII
jgi:hypothetical protein